MGLSLFLDQQPCEHCGRADEVFDWNYTYNCSAMWHKAVPGRKHMIDIEGMTGKESLPLLEQCVAAMRHDVVGFIELNPRNGYGDYYSFLHAVDDLIEAAKKYPDSKWSACR